MTMIAEYWLVDDSGF